MQSISIPALSIDERLKQIAEKVYPIEQNWCAMKRQTATYKRNAFVWRLQKDFKLLSEVQINLVLNELEAKENIQR